MSSSAIRVFLDQRLHMERRMTTVWATLGSNTGSHQGLDFPLFTMTELKGGRAVWSVRGVFLATVGASALQTHVYYCGISMPKDTNTYLLRCMALLETQ